MHLKEQQKRLIPQSAEAGSPLKELAGAQFFPAEQDEVGGQAHTGSHFDALLEEGAGGWGGVLMGRGGGGEGESEGGRWSDEFHDFSDVISSQSEINRLQSELARLRVECQHWRGVAKEKVSTLALKYNIVGL